MWKGTITMKFDLKRPCKDCPFVQGSSTNKTLAEGRIEEIVHSIVEEDAHFQCHKTLDFYSDKKVPAQHCAGATIFLERIGEHGKPNQFMRIAERLGIYDRSKIQMDFEPLIKSEDYCK